jgi:phage-related protein
MAPQIIMGLVEGIFMSLGKIVEVGVNIITKLWEGIKSMFGQLWEWIKEVPSNILTWIWDGLKGIGSIGVDLVKGLWNGIKSVKDWIWDKISGFFGDLWDGICDFFQIGSPSKLFAEGLGQWLPKGLAVGIETNLDSVEDAIDDMNDIVASSFDLQPDISGIGSTFSPQTIVNVQNNMELDPLGQLVNNVKTFSGGAKNDYNWGAGL